MFGERIWRVISSPLATVPVAPVKAHQFRRYMPPVMEIGMFTLIPLMAPVLDWMLVLSSTLVWEVKGMGPGMSRILKMVMDVSPVFPAQSEAVKVRVLSPPVSERV